MEKYGRVLVIIFFLCIVNIGLSIYTLNKIAKTAITVDSPTTSNEPVATRKPTPASSASIQPSIQSELNLIKAEIRALRESLDSNGLIIESPMPKP